MTYIPVLRNEALRANLPRKCSAAVAEHTVGYLGPDIKREDVFKVDACAGGDTAHLFHKWHPGWLLEGREELDGFEAHLEPAEFGSAHEHAFVEGYAAVDLGAGREAVLLADLEVEWLAE